MVHRLPSFAAVASRVVDFWYSSPPQEVVQSNFLFPHRPTSEAMDVLSAAASVIAVIQISESVASLCSQYFTAVKNAKPDIELLQGELGRLKTVLEGAQQILKGPNGARFHTSQPLRDGLSGSSLQLNELEKKLKEKLNLGKTGKVMIHFGFRALNWPFEKGEVDGIIQILKGYRDTLSAALVIDTAQKLVLSKLPIATDAAFDSYAEEHNTRCHANTRIELFHQIHEWVDDPRGQCIFWLKGMAGTGKSTISRTAAQLFANKGKLGASFFFKRGERDRGHAGLFFTTIASQLISKEPRMAPFVREAIDTNPTITSKALREQFEKLVLEPLRKLTGDPDELKPIVIVVDALDECEERDVRVIVNALSQASVKLRLFVTSRPELPIRLGFGDIKGKYQDMVLHEVPEPIIKHDIKAFLDDELARIRSDYNSMLPEHLQLPSDWPGENIIQILVYMAIPLFIFAATVCRFIEDTARSNPAGQLKKVLDYHTSANDAELDKLDATYLPILSQLLAGSTANERTRRVEEFRRLVGPIVLLAEPLSVLSLSGLLDIGPAIILGRLNCLHSVLSVPSKIDVPVRMFHLSFRDFLVDPAKRTTNEFGVDEIECHKGIADRCLRLLDSKDHVRDRDRDRDHLRRDICNLKMPGKARIEVDAKMMRKSLPPHVQYACLYWVYHLERSKDRVRDGGQVHLFLKRHFLHWLEALSLMGKISESIAMIGSLRSLLATDESTEMARFVRHARRFIVQNREIIDIAPLQIYSSAIASTPTDSVIRSMFEQPIPWISRLPKVPPAWSLEIQKLEGHSGPVTAVVFSTDGQLLASTSNDNTVRLWNPATGEQVRKLEGHSNSITAVAFSADSRLLASALLASASYDSTVRLWNPATGEQVRKLKGHPGWVHAIIFSTGGQLLASASDDNMVRLWNSATGEQVQKLEGHSNSVTAVAFSADGRLLASASYDSTVRLWNLAIGEEVETLEQSVTVHQLRFLSDSQSLETEKGILRLRSGRSNVLSLPPKLTGDIFLNGDWVTCDSRNLVWLPHNYQGTCSAWRGHVLVIGQSSGQVHFFEFRPWNAFL
ncbi:hypothetical protein L207DRAFT_572057 [Hyaloscypha variabilis F]|uniref:Mitochondrial division protein 1 n=1 Tax=Hyaloscypha variabilis (strain UAMH 11265 / GT02V1 / F) TaxID=1149755 RepID=A0A2J6R136_HYAVF|nr:hypothetical protein L207DRAFT_572057 [Hyaloscypha variabilis F]